MIPLKDGLNSLHEETCIKVYNPEQQKLIGVYASFAKAAQKLGITPSKVQLKCSTKTRIYSPILKLRVACRLASRKEAEDILIQKTSKYLPL